MLPPLQVLVLLSHRLQLMRALDLKVPVISPNSVINQCLMDFFVFFRIRSSILLTANLHMLSLSFFLLSDFSFSYSSLLIVNVQNVALSGLFFISSLSLITHSRFLAFRQDNGSKPLHHPSL